MQLPRDGEADARMARSRGVLAWMPWVLSYPLRGFCLPVLLMVTLFVTLGMNSRALVPGFPTTGLPLLAITATWTIFYLMQVIQQSARGHAMPPALGGDAVYLTGGLKPLLLPALVATAYFSLRKTHADAALGLLVLAFTVLPVYLFILATEEDLLHALNPLRWLQTMLLMGLPYFAAVALLAAGMTALRAISSVAGVSLLVALMFYVVFAMAHLLGYIGFRRHQRLGLYVEVRHPDAVAREHEQADRMASLLVRIEGCLQRKDEAGAAREIEAEPGGPVSVRNFFEELFRQMLTRGTVHLVHTAGRRLIAVLLNENRAGRALEVAEQCLIRNAHFEPQSPAQLEVLAREALSSKYPELFEKLLRHLDQRYPGDPIVISAQLLRAQYLAEQRNDEAAALALLQPLLGETGHPQHARIVAYARALTHLTRAASR